LFYFIANQWNKEKTSFARLCLSMNNIWFGWFLIFYSGIEFLLQGVAATYLLVELKDSFIHCLKGVENVYTQHQPLLYNTIESIVKGRLRDIDYPFVGNHYQQGRYVTGLWLPCTPEPAESNTDVSSVGLLFLATSPLFGYLKTAFILCRPQEVVIFIVGGTTYEEARTVALQNGANTGTRIILGGSVVLNSKR
jgi:vacuolar protein sorting-associated protein 45